MSRYSVSRIFHRVSSGRVAPFLLVAASILIWAGPATAQRGGSRGGSRGGGGGGDRGEQIRNFFSQMQSRGGNGGSSDDRREQMRAFFSRMQQQRDGGQGGSSRSRGGREGGGREGGSRGGRSRGRGDSNATKPKPVVRVTIDLPENYAAMDRDKDGQLGLYEWKLSAIQQFRTLDTNRDGFLTPRELTSTAGSEETTTASTDDAGDSKKESSDDKKSETSTSPGGTVAVSAAAGPKKDDRTVRIAQYTFKALDKDKDGKLSAEEWQKSSRTRSTFAKKKVKLKLPIDEAGFVAASPPRD